MSNDRELAVDRVNAALRKAGLDSTIQELAASTRTAAEAATAIGCTVGQIGKSLIFRSASGASILVVASGSNQVDEKRVADLVGESISRATPDFVRVATGFSIGGVPPVAHDQTPRAVLIDSDLLQYDDVWVAAGTPHAIVRLTPADLVRISGGRVGQIRK